MSFLMPTAHDPSENITRADLREIAHRSIICFLAFIIFLGSCFLCSVLTVWILNEQGDPGFDGHDWIIEGVCFVVDSTLNRSELTIWANVQFCSPELGCFKTNQTIFRKYEHISRAEWDFITEWQPRSAPICYYDGHKEFVYTGSPDANGEDTLTTGFCLTFIWIAFGTFWLIMFIGMTRWLFKAL